MSEIKLLWRLAFWTVETIVFGHMYAWRLLRLSVRLPLLFANRQPCPRGHRTPVYGVYECGNRGCHAIFEGYVFSKCPVCGESAGWTPCRRCGLPVRNPLS